VNGTRPRRRSYHIDHCPRKVRDVTVDFSPRRHCRFTASTPAAGRYILLGDGHRDVRTWYGGWRHDGDDAFWAFENREAFIALRSSQLSRSTRRHGEDRQLAPVGGLHLPVKLAEGIKHDLVEHRRPFGQCLLQLIEQAVRVERRLGVGAGQKLVENGIGDLGSLRRGISGAPSLPLCPPQTRKSRQSLPITLRRSARDLGCALPEPFFQVAFLPPRVIRHVKAADFGLFAVDKFAPVKE
jgi:hypothetical protein